jgi:hypothetical protein
VVTEGSRRKQIERRGVVVVCLAVGTAASFPFSSELPVLPRAIFQVVWRYLPFDKYLY